MELKFVARRSKSSPQPLLLATIKAVGIVQPPVGCAPVGTIPEYDIRLLMADVGAGARQT
ncbi:hypothetical protein NKH86_28180 [Mesorhizobium sp. M0913]|uniref:hypothetical protein n=1 Tax=Mesorhizobium sp. M0913 TaxID=2957026 RepID=UPI00333515A9